MNELMRECMRAAAAMTSAYRERYWAASGAVNKGTPPPPPDYSEATREGILADIETLPARKVIEAAAKAGSKGSINVGDRQVGYDFTEIGDIDQQKIDLEAQKQAADVLAELALDIQQRYGKKFNLEAMARLKEADPTGFEMRRELARSTLEQLSQGDRLTGEQEANVERYVRGAQSARGNVRGNANVAQEALAKFDAGQRLLQQRMANAQAYAFGAPMSAQFGSLQGAQQGPAPFMPQPMQAGLGLNPNAGAQGAQFAMQGYGNYLQGMQNQSNPWMEGLGIVGGIATKGVVGGIGGKLAGDGFWEGMGKTFTG
tara:strand:+ start:1295 stop:2239 length:945 start_codon:yes stop_codon:yes gene_type:complete